MVQPILHLLCWLSDISIRWSYTRRNQSGLEHSKISVTLSRSDRAICSVISRPRASLIDTRVIHLSASCIQQISNNYLVIHSFVLELLKLVSQLVFNVPFQHKFMAISGTKSQGWRAIPTQYRNASDILTSPLNTWQAGRNTNKHKVFIIKMMQQKTQESFQLQHKRMHLRMAFTFT